MSEPNANQWEPTAAIVISWTAFFAAAASLIVVLQTKGRYPGMENLGYAMAGILALGAAVGCGAIGMIVAGIGLKRARDRDVTVPALSVALVLNLIAFWSVFLFVGAC